MPSAQLRPRLHSRPLRAPSWLSLGSLLACHGSTPDVADGSTGDEADTSNSDTSPHPMTGASSPTGDSSGSSDSSPDASGGSEDTTAGGGPPEPWCGFVGTGSRELEDARFELVPLSMHLGGPIALPIWKYVDGDESPGLRTAVYDKATATWGDTVTLDVSGEVEIYGDNGLGGDPTGAVDAEGNAIVVSNDNLAEPSIRVHRYDAASASWTTSLLTGDFTRLLLAGITVDADGDAILIARNELEYGLNARVEWYYDVATDTWSEPDVSDAIEGYGVSVDWAQDRETGDAAFLVEVAADVMELRHRSAATGTWTAEDVDLPASPYFYPADLVSTGEGRFVALAGSGSFGVDNGQVTAYAYEDGGWQPPFVVDQGIDLSDLRASSDQNGRVLVTWSVHPTSIRARTYDTSSGWSPLHIVNAGQEGANYVDYSTHVMDDDGFVVGWTQYHSESERTYVRRLDADGWSPIADIDPGQPELSSISALQAIGSDATRVVWARDSGNANYTGWYYACHEPEGAWSDPVAFDLEYPRFQAHEGGEMLVVGWRGEQMVAEYFAGP